MENSNRIARRQVLKWTAAVGIAVSAESSLSPFAFAAPEKVDWSQGLIQSTLKRIPDPKGLGVWGYQPGLYLIGQYMLYRRTKDRKLLDYIVGYLHAHLNAAGELDQPIDSLDAVLSANLLVIMYEETRDPWYKVAADRFRRRFDTYPRTSEGGFWHGDRPERSFQLWLDGVYMAVPFLLRYGRAFGDSKYANAEAVRQLLVYYSHLKSDQMGLLYHAWDESGKADWADPKTHHSAYFWCRATGWFGMTLVDTLDVIPHDQPQRDELIRILQELVVGLAHYQDAKTGLWYQILDKPTLDGNWTETSSSSMFTYVMDVAVKRGYIDKKYLEVARKGYNGVMSRVTLGADGMTNIAEICIGTNVGDLAWYLARPRLPNDFHGLGAFLLMNEEWNTSVSNLKYS